LYGTDSNKTDTDGDGYPDGDEVRNGYDPLKSGDFKLDSDSDNLYENDECKWGTDPFNADTDGDSYKDGDEIKNGYDPTIKGDGKGSDALPEKRAAEAENYIRPNPNSSNYTEGLTGILLGNTTLGEAGQTTVTSTQIQQVLSTAKLDMELPEVKVTELNVIKNNTGTDIQAYLNSIDLIRPNDLLNSTTLTNSLMSAFSGNTAGIQGIRNSLTQYEQKLLAVPTPPSAVEHQKLLVSVTKFLNEKLGVIQTNGKTDPVKAYLAARELQEGLPTNIEKLDYLKNKLLSLI